MRKLENQVMWLLAHGLSHRAIARELGLTLGTVVRHANNGLRRLKAGK